MSLLWMDGFDHFANINGAAATATAIQTAGYTATTQGSDSMIVTTGRIPGTFALRLRNIQSTNMAATLSRTFHSEEDLVVIGFAYMATERSNIVQIEDLVTLEWPVGCRLNGVDGEAIPIRNIWYYMELVIDKQADTISLYINNHLDIVAPLPAEGQSMTDYNVRWGAAALTGAANTTQYIDDLIFIDGAGSAINDRIGPIEITTRFPSSDNTADWEPSVPGPLYPMVNSRPPQAGNYIQSNVAGQEATFFSSQTLPSDSQIFALGVVARALKTDIDDRALGLVWGDDDQRLEVVDANLSTENKYSYAFFEEPAPGQSWTKEIVESNSFGVKIRP